MVTLSPDGLLAVKKIAVWKNSCLYGTRVAGLLDEVGNSLEEGCQNILFSCVGISVYHHLKCISTVRYIH